MARQDRRNRTRYWLDRERPGLSLLSADLTTHEYPPHTHDALLVAVTEAGGSEIGADGGPQEVHGAALLVVNPAEAHSSRMRRSTRWRYRSFYLEEDALGDVLTGLGVDRLPAFARNVVPDRDLIQDFLALHRGLEGAADPLRRRELLVGTFGRLVRRYGSSGARVAVPPRDRALLARAVGVLRQRYAEPVTLSELAGAAGLTQYQLIGLFRRGTGLTPHAYLTQLRLEVARDRLRRAVPIAEAALAAGFYDQAALTRHFKRRFGITPLQFTRAASG
ncbi:MAG: AraC family transcriptional regulator [Candidatus Dormibacteraeota bacterium]|nr:AraC family transcriptional regulator [Candidatus Dormibacteraeota bacterium]MBO0762718.1 AraC family transcriptional regulator [Candidatus Dormibacteraeota bacterium]